jgi:hypothetical protein
MQFSCSVIVERPNRTMRSGIVQTFKGRSSLGSHDQLEAEPILAPTELKVVLAFWPRVVTASSFDKVPIVRESTERKMRSAFVSEADCFGLMRKWISTRHANNATKVRIEAIQR